jgi:hypothetical protein
MYQLSGQSRIIAGDETVTIWRDGRVLNVDGKPVKQAQFSFPLEGNVQPTSGLDLMSVPEGDRHLEWFTVFKNTLDRPAQLSDTVIRRGITYEIRKLRTWGVAPNGYQHFLMCRIDVGPSRNFPDTNQEPA